jgi:hypothetical protein
MIIALALSASLIVRGDFNHDGHRDLARIERIRDENQIVVELARGVRQIVYRGDFNDPYVAINHEQGWVRTACGKGYDLGCTRQDPNKIYLRGGELLFGNREASDFVVIYRSNHAVVVQLSD